MSQVNSVRNPEGVWINTQGFREQGERFKKRGVYSLDPWGSPDWYDYWQEQRRRCINGYSEGGVHITGDHYFYLNFCPIRKVGDSTKKKSKKITGFPDFWDGDYNYFWSREIARNGILENPLVTDLEREEFLHLETKEEVLKLKKYLDRLQLTVRIEPDYLQGGWNLIVGKSRRKGYQLPHSEIVMTPRGKKTMGDMKVGDEVSTPTGKAKIIEMYPQGEDDVYKITLYDGRTVKCGKEHLWKVYSSSFRKDYRQEKVVQTDFLLKQELKTKKGYKWFLPLNEKVVNENIKELPIPAYTMGCILGDGNVSKQLKISGVDQEVFDNIIEELGDSYYFCPAGKANQQLNYKFTKEELVKHKKNNTLSKYANRFNPLYLKLKKLNLDCCSAFKYIPDIYKYHSTIQQRLDLVKGLMDTDGTIGKDGSSSFANTSSVLVKDLQEVLYSLGVASTFRVRKDGLFIIYINTDLNLFKLTRKSSRVLGRNVRKYIPIIKVEKLKYKEKSSCFLLDSKEHLFLTNKYVVTHNSFKNAAIAANNYLCKPSSNTYLGAYEKKFLYPDGLFTMTYSYVNFLSEHTAWIYPRDYINQPGKGHIRASTQEYRNGVAIETGFKSQIISVSFKDDADAARGKDGYDFIIDEAGAFGTPGLLKDTLVAIQDIVKDGDIKTGIITVFGTSGDMEGGTADYADMHSKPAAYGFMPFQNIWDENSEEFECGFFHPNQWNLPGHYDEQGNSNQKSAIQAEKAQRKFLLSKGATSTDIQKRMQERPLSPQEAFGFVNINNFPVLEIKRQLEIVKGKKLQEVMGTPVNMFYDSETNRVKAEPILDGTANPIYRMKPESISLAGCPVIYEYPMFDPPKSAYKIGYDPYRQDKGTSLASIIVYKPIIKGEHTKMQIVAEYIGRPGEADDVTYIAKLFAMLYNTQIMYENEVTHVKDYFRKRKELHYLAAQPNAVISKNIKNSRVARVYGCHMNDKMKDAGEKYIKTWLLSTIDFDENEDPVRVIDKIYSVGLLEELINYNRKGNFDRVMALMQVMFQDEEDMVDKEYNIKSSSKTKINQLLAMQHKMYNKNRNRGLVKNFN